MSKSWLIASYGLLGIGACTQHVAATHSAAISGEAGAPSGGAIGGQLAVAGMGGVSAGSSSASTPADAGPFDAAIPRDASVAAQAGRASPAADGGRSAIAGSGAAIDAGRSARDAGTGTPDAGPAADISLAGLVSALELAPVRVANGSNYPARITITSGGVDNLFSGDNLVATNAETQALRSSVQHPNLRIIFTVCEGLYRIVAKRSANISQLSDLRGKTVAVPKGTSSEYFLERMLESVNLTERDLTVSDQLPGAGVLSAEAATIWEPGIQYVEDGLKSDAIDLPSDGHSDAIYRELFDLHATAESLADADKRRTIVRLVKALIDASAEIRSDPSHAISLLIGPTGASQADLAQSMQHERFAGTLVSDLLDVLVQEETWSAAANGRSARTRAQLAPLVDDSVFKEASAL
ncbi:MAG TPA: ABC transporter substrate-binding protein [Polyangiales bacterium]|jgi:NitT/TauT family transport system substrate-binding protein